MMIDFLPLHRLAFKIPTSTKGSLVTTKRLQLSRRGKGVLVHTSSPCLEKTSLDGLHSIDYLAFTFYQFP